MGYEKYFKLTGLDSRMILVDELSSLSLLHEMSFPVLSQVFVYMPCLEQCIVLYACRASIDLHIRK